MNPIKNKILLVDDDPRNIFALKTVLRSKGYDCLTAQSGAEAIAMVNADNGIGVVLIDMMMPEMDGYETMARIRSDEKSNRIPVIAVTAQAMKGDREKCLDAGASEYIPKPVDIDLLLPALRKYIG
jgi:CheY-like chemotaxis protein